MGCVHASSIRIVSREEALACDVLITAENTEGCTQDLDSHAKILNHALTTSKLQKDIKSLTLYLVPRPVRLNTVLIHLRDEESTCWNSNNVVLIEFHMPHQETNNYVR